ncbi:MAG: 2-oxoacid:ferredoxin oxidoreductase subunit gamma, partial [Ruminiclostridium sp.]|nr:2-oxoacid:ferredoxin oxidoreductase subunit gamma [Ruminiclostridium sp.]
SYGPEMRGGTSNCHIIISDEPIGSPILNSSGILIVMSGPSLEKFENMVVTGGLIVIDSALVNRSPKRNDVEVISIPATKLALEMGNQAYSNVIILGRLLRKIEVVSIDSIKQALIKVLPEKKHYLIPEELKALDIGMNFMA